MLAPSLQDWLLEENEEALTAEVKRLLEEAERIDDGANKVSVQRYNAQIAAAGAPQIVVAQTVVAGPPINSN